MKPKISIIIPVYNVEKYLKKCLDSLINQTLQEIEIILINDGSTDESQKIIDQYKKKDKRIISIKKENGGQGSARNLGIKKSKGEFIMFVDSDDYVDLEICEKLYDIAITNKAGIVFTNYFEVYENHDVIKTDKKQNHITDIKKYFLINQSGPVAKIIDSNILKNNNLYFPNLRAYEDISVVPAWGLFSEKICYLDENLYYYLIRQGSTMNQTIYNEKLTNIFSSLENLKKYFDDENDYYEELEWIYIEHLLHAASLRFFKFDNYLDNIDKIIYIMKTNFPNWKKNKYYKKQSIKYKIVCNLFFNKKFRILKILLKEGY